MSITPEQIIDTSENKPVIDEQPMQAPTPSSYEQRESKQCFDNCMNNVNTVEIKANKVKDLTTEERLKLISDAKNGIEHPLFKVQFYKNGNSRIIKRKQPLDTTAERIIKQRSPTLTTEQLLMEHVIGLESQLATLKQKHKKLKHNYKSLYQDVYVDDTELTQNNSINMIPTTNALNDIQDNTVNNNECLDNVEQQQASESSQLHSHELGQTGPQQQNIFTTNKTRGWRARIANSMSYDMKI